MSTKAWKTSSTGAAEEVGAEELETCWRAAGATDEQLAWWHSQRRGPAFVPWYAPPRWRRVRRTLWLAWRIAIGKA